MVEDGLIDELQAFGLSINDGQSIEKFRNLCDKWNIDVITLVEKYVAFQRNANLSDAISLKHIDLFDKEVSVKFVMGKSKQSKVQTNSTNLLTKNMLQELAAAETFNEEKNLLSCYTSNSSVLESSLLSKKLFVDKENIPDTKLKESILVEYPCSINTKLFSNLVSGVRMNDYIDVALHNRCRTYRYMNQHALEKSEVLDNWLWNLTKRILESMPDEEFTDLGCITPSNSQPTFRNLSMNTVDCPNAFSQPVDLKCNVLERVNGLRSVNSRIQGTALITGRIAIKYGISAVGFPLSDGTSKSVDEVKNRLLASNACLVGIRRTERVGSGLIIPDLDLASLKSYSLYAGQPVVMRAMNATGHLLGVQKIYTVPTLNPLEIDWAHHDDLHVMIACGPYTLSESHDSSGLLFLLRAVKEHKPQVLILLGPLVDSEQPSIESYFEATYEELFQSRLNTVAEWCSHLGIRLVFVSSYREVHNHPVYPTPPIDVKWTQQSAELIKWYENVLFVPDPCLLKIGQIVFGITSVDVLRELGSEEINNGCSGDRIGRLCHHILASSSFYPVHPPADNFPLDYLLWEQFGQMELTPHCLIVPSRLRQFVKNVDNVLCINPGYVSRGQAFGSYAKLLITAKDLSMPNGGSTMNNGDVSSDSTVIKSVGVVHQSVASIHRIGGQ